MEIRKVCTPEDVRHTYPCATESPPPFWADGLSLARAWFSENLGKHIEGFHLEDEPGSVIGHIYWAPGERALAPYEIEDGVAYIYCEWVQRSYRGQGGMHLLFQGLVECLRSQGYKGILVRGTEFESYMHYQHFLKRGFHIISGSDGGKLLYYPLSRASVTVRPITGRVPGKAGVEVEILVIGSHFCPVGASAVLAVRKVARELGERVRLEEVPASRDAVARYGVAHGIFINGKVKLVGPVGENQVRQAIEEELSQGRYPV